MAKGGTLQSTGPTYDQFTRWRPTAVYSSAQPELKQFVYASIHPNMASMPASTALIIVDVQNDFLPPTGSLAVPNGREVLPVITGLLDRKWDWAVVVVSQVGILPPLMGCRVLTELHNDRTIIQRVIYRLLRLTHPIRHILSCHWSMPTESLTYRRYGLITVYKVLPVQTSNLGWQRYWRREAMYASFERCVVSSGPPSVFRIIGSMWW